MHRSGGTLHLQTSPVRLCRLPFRYRSQFDNSVEILALKGVFPPRSIRQCAALHRFAPNQVMAGACEPIDRVDAKPCADILHGKPITHSMD